MQQSIPKRYKPIFLTGMPGSGKSYWAPLIADAYGVRFLDLDRELERQAGRDIPAIFREQGETVFRELEADTLADVLKSNPENIVIACGGGTPCFGDNLLLMRQSGRVVYLQATIHWLEQNILKSKELRPLLGAEGLHQRLDLLLQEREQYYAHADDVLSAELLTIADFAAIFHRAAL